jgi:hypothetical protein
VIFQSAPGELSKKAILRVLAKKGTNLSFQKRIILKIFWIPMRVGVNE